MATTAQIIVKDFNSEEPLINCPVTINAVTVNTNNQGKANFSNLAPDNYDLTIDTYTGYAVPIKCKVKIKDIELIEFGSYPNIIYLSKLVTSDPETRDITFLITDSTSTDPIEDVTVKILKQSDLSTVTSGVTDALGEIELTVPEDIDVFVQIIFDDDIHCVYEVNTTDLLDTEETAIAST